jgi:hypothetical protein
MLAAAAAADRPLDRDLADNWGLKISGMNPANDAVVSQYSALFLLRPI